MNNNPENGKDSGGGVVETVFDVISLAGSVVDVCCNPMDPWAWAGLAGDAIDLVPFATGVGESIKGMRALAKAADTADDARDASKAVSSIQETVEVVGENVCIGGCFIAGTLIKTEEGNRKIEDIQVGDLVYAKDAVTGETGYKQVTELFRVEKRKLIHLQVGEEEIITTEEHPFWVDGYGFMEAGELSEGYYVESAKGELLLLTKVEVEYLEKPVTVYNFEVEDWHTYYVSSEEIFVHNMCATPQGIGNPVAIEGRGSTGRTVPNSLKEQMVMHQVQSNPLEGAIDMSQLESHPIIMSDPRWPASDGWIKMSNNVNGVEVHFVHNKLTGAFDDFKFK